MEHFKKHTVNKHTGDFIVYQSPIDELTDIELIVHKTMDNEFTIYESMTDKLMTMEPRIPEKCLLIINCHVSRCSLKFFQFSGDNNIELVCLSPHAKHLLQPVDIGILEPLSNT